MGSILSGFEYDIFISYRQKDNKGDQWVTGFVSALKTELEATFKEDISIYFDASPHGGLLETHIVDKSLEGKLKCLIFVPIISQTYCDPKSFAWQHEFCAFNSIARADRFGRDVRLISGNVASRILPVKIHDLDAGDKSLLENELGGVLRAVEFIFKSSGVNRPLTLHDKRDENANKTFYRDQVNKVANAVKEIIGSLKDAAAGTLQDKTSKGQFAEKSNTPETFIQKAMSRDLLRVALVYGIFAFLVFQLSRTVITWLQWPSWATTLIMVLLATGFPIALFLAWRFEFGPQGIIRSTSVEALSNPFSSSRKKPFTGNAVLGLLFLVLLAQYFISSPATVSKPEEDNSIAVLYFDNISSDPEQDYFSEGITEEITAHLSAIKGLRVTSRTSVIPFKGKAINIREIARQLNVNNVLEGSVRKAGDKLRITAQLIDARTDQHVWTEVYDRNLADVFKIQSEIAHSIADKFKIAISPEANAKIVATPTTNIKAYELYLKARSIPLLGNGLGIGSYYGGYEKAKRLLKEAIALDPDYAQPYILLINFSPYDSAEFLAKEAIIRNPKSAEGYLALAGAMNNKKSSLKWLRKACELDSSACLLSFATYYAYSKDYPNAIQIYSHVIKMDPNLYEPYLGKAWAYYYMAQPDSMEKYVAWVSRLAPNTPEVNGLLTHSAQFNGQSDAVIEPAKKYYLDDTLNYNKVVGIAFLFARKWKAAESYYARTHYRDMDWALVKLKTGKTDSGKLLLKKSLDYRRPDGSPGDLSRIHAVLGNKNLAISYFKKLLETGWNDLFWLRNDPYWDEIRQEPEFKKMTEEMERKNKEMLHRIKEDQNKRFSLDF